MLEEFDTANQSILNAVLRIHGVVTNAWVVRNIAEPVATHPRFRSVLDRRAAKFVLDDSFNVASHVTPCALRLTSDELNRAISTSLPVNRPLWQVHVYPDDERGTDVLFRVHHIIGDGGGLVRFFLDNVLTPSPNDKTESGQVQGRQSLHTTLVAAGARTSLLDWFTRPFRDVFAMCIESLFGSTITPFCENSLELSGCKRVAFSRNRDVLSLRNATRRLGITINDLLLAALVGALRKLYPALKTMNIGVPKFMAHEGDQLYNAVSMLTMYLPMDKSSVADRVAACVRLMCDRKAGYRASLCLAMVGLLQILPKFVRGIVWSRVTKRIPLAFTNVPGPTIRMRCGGRDIDDARVVAAGLGEAGVVLTAFSYVGTLRVNLCVDTAKMNEPENLIRVFDEQLDELLEWIEEFVSHEGTA